MNYYLLPTKNMSIVLNPIFSDQEINYISDSFIRNLKSLYCQVKEFETYYNTIIPTKTINDIHKINNIYSFVFDVISKDVEMYLNLAKNETNNQTFFIMIEMYNTFDFIKDVFDMYSSDIMYIGNTPETFQTIIQYIQKTPPGLDQIKVTCNTLDQVYQYIYNGKHIENTGNHGFIFFDFDYEKNEIENIKNYTLYLLKSMYIALKTKQTCIIKIWEIIHKPIVDIIYMLTGIYKNVYICKPTTTQYQNDRFIICKDINNLYEIQENINKLENNIISVIRYINEQYNTSTDSVDTTLYIQSLIENSLSQHFINKIEESTLIVGQKNIEYYENLIMILKLYSKDDKLDSAKKNSIIKCAQWCSKNNIPIKTIYMI